MLMSVQDRCMVCAKHTIGEAPMVLLGGEALMEARFGQFGDMLVSGQDRCTVCAKCTTSSEIVLNTPDGTPRRRGSSENLFQYLWRYC
jgi:uncharacterized protein (DUF1800 family)